MVSAADARAAAQSRVRWELLANLIRKDLKVKYKNSALGFLWSMANPLLYLAVFDVVFSVFLKKNVRFRDVEHLLEIALLAWFWLTPIVYPVALVQEQLVHRHLFWVYMANPMTAVVTAMQRALYRYPSVVEGGGVQRVLATGGYGFYLKWLGVASVVSLVLLALGLVVFRRLEADFAEEL